MSTPEPRVVPRSRRTDLALAVGVFVALFAATVPLLRVVDSGPWLSGVLCVSALVLATGFAARWWRLAGIIVSLLELAVWIGVTTALFSRGTALFGIIPTPDTLALIPVMVQAAIEDVTLGVAPLEAGPALTFLIVTAVGLLAIVLDHVVLTARMPLLAAVGLVTISLIPSIAVSGDFDGAAFAFLAVSILVLLSLDTRARREAVAAPLVDADGAGRSSGTASGMALGIGAIAIVVTLVASPLLPTPLARAGGGTSFGAATINPSLEMGDDLRQPGEVEVLKMHWTGSLAPYLRVTTLSNFDGDVWDPQTEPSVPLEGDAPDFAPVPVDGDIEVTEDRTSVEITSLSSRWAPVPYPAIDVTGLDGAWEARPDNHTVVAAEGSVFEQTYEVTTARPTPSLEQMRAHSAGGWGDDALYELPREMPDIIASTAAEVTADTRTDYDALVALQSWFRGGSFSYSLDAPVEDGFDGSGVEAIAEFLQVGEGYCVHFASAFAVMARTLGMPARIVVGYLPGSSTGTSVDDQFVYTVASTQLHAWPEVHFEGVGWIPFEPTNSLGTPTNFASSSASAPGSAPSDGPDAASPSATPTPTSSTDALRPDERDLGSTGAGGSSASVDPWPGIGIALGTLLILAAPGTIRALRRRRLLAATRRGDATAAWLSVQELAIDLGIPVPAAESPRAFGRRLVAQHGADHTAMDTLVLAIERASYAGDPGPTAGARWAGAVATAGTGLRETASPVRRFIARVLPRSLVVRPGSAYAGVLPPQARGKIA